MTALQRDHLSGGFLQGGKIDGSSPASAYFSSGWLPGLSTCSAPPARPAQPKRPILCHDRQDHPSLLNADETQPRG